MADVQHLQFDGKFFDFVYCSHVLEHIENLIKACQEIMRVGKRGYVETPNFAKDILFCWAGDTGHKWHIVSIDCTLVFFEYTKSQKKGIKSHVWREIIFAPFYHPIQEGFWKNQDMFNSMLMWEDNFRVVVFRNDGTVDGM